MKEEERGGARIKGSARAFIFTIGPQSARNGQQQSDVRMFVRYCYYYIYNTTLRAVQCILLSLTCENKVALLRPSPLPLAHAASNDDPFEQRL